jgi:tetratricopeptide (TPR) repeat protein
MREFTMKRNIRKSIKEIMTGSLLITIAALAIVMYSFAFSFAEESAVLQNYKRGERLPSIKLPTTKDMHPQLFTPGKGKPAIVMFFSIRPDFRKKRSLALLSTLSDLADQYKTKLDVIGIYSDSRKMDTVKKYMENSSINMVVYNDSKKKVYNKFGVFMMPLVVLSDGDGKLHEIIPYTYNIREIIDGNIKFLLGEWDKDRLVESLKPKEMIIRSKEEKEFIRRINYGRIMQSKKMYGQAVREFSNAVKLMPQLIEGHIDLGFALYKSKKYDQAEGSFREALKINAESDDAIAGLGLAYYGQGKIEPAFVELEKAFIASSPSLDVIITLAEIYEKKGFNEKANRLNKLAVSRLMTMYEQRWK